MPPKSSDRRSHPPEQPITFETMRKALIDRKQATIKTTLTKRQQELARLKLLLRDREHPTQFGAGWDEKRAVKGREKLAPAEVEAFAKDHSTPQSLDALDVSLPPLAPAAHSANSSAAAASSDNKPDDVEMADEAATKLNGKSFKTTGSSTPATAADDALAVPQVVVAPSSPQAATGPTSPTQAKSPAVQSPAQSRSAVLVAPPASSANATASTSTTTINPSLLSIAPPTTHAPYAAPPFHSAFPIVQLASDYASTLPPLPAEVGRARLGPSLRRKGKEKAGGGPDLYRMHVKAKHTGAANFLGRGKRVHNVLSTRDWGVGLEEIRAQRAFDRIEQLKLDRAWSFRQPKKQRAGLVPKAHWDHLLDEMRWLQTDFRQEARWQKVTAYNLARAVKDWHRASDDEREAMCVKTRPPTLLPLPGEQPDAEPMEVDADADGEVDADADGEEDDADAGTAATSKPADRAAPAAAAASAPTAKPAAEAEPTEAQKASKAALHIQNLIASRAPVFELPIEATLIDPAALSRGEDDELSTSLGALFPDLPLYSDFLLSNEPQGDKRVDEASLWAGRLSHVSRLLESKPLLVSTVQPSRTRTRDGWVPGAAVLLEDGKETVEPHEIPPSSSQLFAGKKSKDAVQPEQLVRTAPAQILNPDQRAASLFWAPEDDALLVSLQAQYAMNWALIAETFNAAAARPSSDHRLPWDLYDRWDRTVGPGSKKTLADGTEVAVPLPEYQPLSDKAGLAPQFANFAGPKKRLRHLTVFDAMRKVQKKREISAAKQPPPGLPRRVNMTMHDSHNVPPRPLFTPMEWASVRVENDAKMRMRQEEIRLRAQAQQMQQQQAAAALAAQQVGQGGQPGQMQQQQFRGPQPGFPQQPQRVASGGQVLPGGMTPQHLAAQIQALQQQQQQGVQLTQDQINLYRGYQQMYQQQQQVQAQQAAQQAQHAVSQG